jgi:hypothetical protein
MKPRAYLIAVFALSVVPAFAEPLVVKVDGKVVEFQGTRPKTVSGRVMVPLRGVFEAIGAYVEYNPVLHRIVARKQNEDIELRIGDKIAKKNGSEITIDAPPIAVRGRAMVPLRFLAESLGANVEYDKANNIVNITTTEKTTDPKEGVPPPR